MDQGDIFYLFLAPPYVWHLHYLRLMGYLVQYGMLSIIGARSYPSHTWILPVACADPYLGFPRARTITGC